ncbi:MAG: histone deacetylase [Candidatus Omnitrophica bacterium]|nr:histone deacetylase [Candidatus Omnitrophota bacterium]MBU4488949.1 histone deacetylase [Candidatus Omnitrophota bacterium]MCG2705245.1 histone deacetylase [Candidatus Omnitrophota bacterium]
MGKNKVVYSDEYEVDIGAHVFPTEKYRLIRARLVEEKVLGEGDFEFALPASDDDILLVHSKEYVSKLKNGTLSAEDIFTLELPYSEEIVRSSYVCVGGTILSSKIALAGGVGIHIGGGFHHAFRDHGEGFCVLNDVAVAIKKMVSEKKIRKAMVIDCDLHQGNGTADIFWDDKDVFTFSIHQEHNYPFHKPKSDMDIGLEDYASDGIYLGRLREHIPKIISDFKPGLILYVAGADPYEGDQIGNLSLTVGGLKKRDEFIFETAENFGVPVSVVLAGGYAENIEDIVTIHCNTVKTGLKYTK